MSKSSKRARPGGPTAPAPPEAETMPAVAGTTCRVCGCTDAKACRGGCYWVTKDLCSRCAFHALVRDLTVGKIRLGKVGHRAKGKDPAFDGLVATMASAGLLEPIGVMAAEGRGDPTLIFGGRRLAAAKKLGWKTIRAVVYPFSGVAGLAVLQAVENVQRWNLNPLEEASAIASLLATVMGKPALGPGMTPEASVRIPPAAIRHVADTLGKPVKWVKDRLVLLRLGSKVRDYVADGRLGLAQARELAKLADPRRQMAIVQGGLRRADGSGGYTVERVRDHVAADQCKLKGVRWELGESFAGKRACVGCAHSTDEATRLFSDQVPEDELGDARCLKASCWQHKWARAELGVETVRSKARDHSDLPSTATALTQFAPRGLKMSAAIRQVKRDRGEGAKPKPRPQGGGEATHQAPKKTPAEKHQDAVHKWAAQCRIALKDAARKDPLRLLVWLVARTVPSMAKLSDYLYGTGAQQEKIQARRMKAARKALALVGQATPEAALALAKLAQKNEFVTALFEFYTPEPAYLAVAKAWGVDLPKKPAVDDFRAKPKKPAQSKAAAKPSKGRKKRPVDESAAEAQKPAQAKPKAAKGSKTKGTGRRGMINA